jgi:hypothetical protein
MASYSHEDLRIDIPFDQYRQADALIANALTNGFKHFAQKTVGPASKSAYVDAWALNNMEFKKVRQLWATMDATVKADNERGIIEFVGSLIAIGTSIYALHEVNEVAARQDADHKLIVENRQLVADIEKSFVEYASDMAMADAIRRYSAQMHVAITTHRQDMEHLLEILVKAQIMTLSDKLITQDMIERVVPEFRDRIEARGYDIVDHGARPLIGHPISYILGNNGIRILVHVPIAKPPSSVMTLWKLESASMEGVGITVKFSGEEEFLAVDRKGIFHLPLSAADLLTCRKDMEVFYCPSHNVLFRQSMTCVAAAFFGEEERMAKLCSKAFFRPDRQGIVETDEGFDITADFTVECEHSASKHSGGRQFVKSNSTCQIQSQNFVATPPATGQTLVVTQLNVTTTKIGLEDSHVADIIAALNLPHVDSIDERSIRRSDSWLTWIAISVGVILLICGIAAFYLMKVLQAKKTVQVPEAQRQVPEQEERAFQREPSFRLNMNMRQELMRIVSELEPPRPRRAIALDLSEFE